KVFPAHGLMSPTHLERFRREARAAARLHHTNIVPVHGVGEHDGVHYYAMQFIQGQGLDEVLKEVKRLRGQKAPSADEGPGRGTVVSQSLAQSLLSGQFAGPDSFGQDGEGSVSSPVPPEKGRSREPDGAGAAGSVSDSASGAELTSQTEAQYFRS